MLKLWGIPLAVAAAGLYYGRFIEPFWLETTRIPLRIEGLHPDFDGYRIVQISDIHINDWMMSSHIHRSIESVNRLSPNLIVLTGDFVTRNVPFDLNLSIRIFRKLRATDGVIAIPGNHDHKEDGVIQTVRQLMRESGMVDLSNTHVTLCRGGGHLHIAGVDDVSRRQSRLDMVLAQLPDQGPVILLAHEPDFADISAPTGRFVAQLSGHSHGGQVRLPIIKRLVLPIYGRRYVAGLYDVDGMQLYVNRGLGMVGMPFRFMARPEITVFTLRPRRSRPEQL